MVLNENRLWGAKNNVVIQMTIYKLVPLKPASCCNQYCFTDLFLNCFLDKN